DEPGGAVGVMAGASATNLGRPSAELLDAAGIEPAVGEGLQVAGDRPQAERDPPAPPRRFLPPEPNRPGRHRQPPRPPPPGPKAAGGRGGPRAAAAGGGGGGPGGGRGGPPGPRRTRRPEPR